MGNVHFSLGFQSNDITQSPVIQHLLQEPFKEPFKEALEPKA